MFLINALDKLKNLENTDLPDVTFDRYGKVTEVIGTVIETSLNDVPLGALVRISDSKSQFSLEGEVVGFRKEHTLVIPFADPVGIRPGSLVQCIERQQTLLVGDHLIGRIVDPYLNPMAGKPFTKVKGVNIPMVREPINPLLRRRITRPLDLGVRALNSFLTCGEGQRVGIMAGSGVGKSVLLGMIARYTEADINVIALVGERGREVREFLEENLGEEGLARSIVVVATGDQSPLVRIRAAHAATAIAEHFRESGKRVLLMMDSLTRVAMAAREVGLAIGEPPTTKGYTPSVFSLLSRLLERGGNSDSAGSMTGIYTVLVDGDDFNDPICDAARSILDGHVNLSRQLATQGHFPAIDVLSSASRVMGDIVSKEHFQVTNILRELLATYVKNEDLISIGAYNKGTSTQIDRAIDFNEPIRKFLTQGMHEKSSYESSLNDLRVLSESVRDYADRQKQALVAQKK